MAITGQVGRQTLLFSLLILIAPMILFPEQLGLNLTGISVVYAACELVYYMIVMSFVVRRFGDFRVSKVAQAAGICLVYRLLLGAIFGLLIVALYSLTFTVAMTLGLFSYLPAILLHAAATPFILTPIVRELSSEPSIPSSDAEEPSSPRYGFTPSPRKVEQKSAELSGLASRVVPAAAPRVPPVSAQRISRRRRFSGSESANINGFEQAVRFIGEDTSVQLAAVVDREGLLLGHFRRGTMTAEDWAPFSLLFADANGRVLKRVGWVTPEKIDIVLKEQRIVIAPEGAFLLMVIAERQPNDLLSIRITRGLEILKRYTAERYGQKRQVKVEKTYV